jgi:hypothetical protein
MEMAERGEHRLVARLRQFVGEELHRLLVAVRVDVDAVRVRRWIDPVDVSGGKVHRELRVPVESEVARSRNVHGPALKHPRIARRGPAPAHPDRRRKAIDRIAELLVRRVTVVGLRQDRGLLRDRGATFVTVHLEEGRVVDAEPLGPLGRRVPPNDERPHSELLSVLHAHMRQERETRRHRTPVPRGMLDPDRAGSRPRPWIQTGVVLSAAR